MTQLTLGAAVGEALLGRRTGRRAALWGSVAGMTPDLDVLLGVFTSETTQLAYIAACPTPLFLPFWVA